MKLCIDKKEGRISYSTPDVLLDVTRKATMTYDEIAKAISYLMGTRPTRQRFPVNTTTCFVRNRFKCVGQKISLFWQKPIKFSDDKLFMLMVLLGAYELEKSEDEKILYLDFWRFKSLYEYMSYSQLCENLGCHRLRVLLCDDLLYETQFIPNMTTEEKAFYAVEVTRRSWMREITMTDYELESALIRHLGEIWVKDYYTTPRPLHWLWICNDVLKYFYAKDKFVLLHEDSLDRQNAAIITEIMKKRNDTRTIDDITYNDNE